MMKVLKSFGYAINGIAYSFKSQLNFKIHFFFTVGVIAAGFLTDLSSAEWSSIIFSIGLVLVAELFNTAIELLVDLVSPEYNKKAGLVKDISAGAVLIAAISAVVIGLIIFVPKVLSIYAL